MSFTKQQTTMKLLSQIEIAWEKLKDNSCDKLFVLKYTFYQMFAICPEFKKFQEGKVVDDEDGQDGISASVYELFNDLLEKYFDTTQSDEKYKCTIQIRFAEKKGKWGLKFFKRRYTKGLHNQPDLLKNTKIETFDFPRFLGNNYHTY